MELDFDKEIDALLRQTARGDDSVSNHTVTHLDADEISAFAENALPEKTRQNYMAHLADCARCRKNLSNLIQLNAETESVAVHTKERKIVSLPIPRYRKLFVFPNLAYTMGALVLVFSGIALYTVLRSVGDSQNAEVSQVSEKQIGGKGMSSDGDATVAETYSSNSMMSNAASMNTTSNSSINTSSSAIPSAPMIAMNSNAAIARNEPDKDLSAVTKSLVEQNAPKDAAKNEDSTVAVAPPPPPKENKVDTEAEKQLSQNSIARKQTNELPSAGRSVQPAPMTTMRSDEDDKNKKAEESRANARLKSAETIGVGGKNFKRANNVWIDSAYRGQATTNIARGTKEYKKLDSGLRGIAENLGGTVVVVWKEKAYRIQ